MNNSTTARRLPQFRITVNSRCGHACFFCRPSGEAVATEAGTQISPDDLLIVAREVRRAGVAGVKLTGGDPALYDPLEDVVRRLRDEAGYEEIEIISRHPAMAERAIGLAAAGVTQFNLSLDTLDPMLHRQITGVDDHRGVLEALHACVATGVPVKVNMVVMGGVNADEIAELVDYCENIGVRTLKLLDVIKDLDAGAESFARRLTITRGSRVKDLFVSLSGDSWLHRAPMKDTVRGQGDLGHPMRSLTFPSGFEVLVKDSGSGAWYGQSCRTCPLYPCHDALMGLRLTADLRLQFCLLREDITVPLVDHLRAGDTATLKKRIRDALQVYADATFHNPDAGRGLTNNMPKGWTSNLLGGHGK